MIVAQQLDSYDSPSLGASAKDQKKRRAKEPIFNFPSSERNSVYMSIYYISAV